jgi:hypothetical protein
MLNKIFKMSFEYMVWPAGIYRDGLEARDEKRESKKINEQYRKHLRTLKWPLAHVLLGCT